MRDNLNWILYAMHGDTSISVYTALWIILVDTIQWSYFGFLASDLFDWNGPGPLGLRI